MIMIHYHNTDNQTHYKIESSGIPAQLMKKNARLEYSVHFVFICHGVI